MHTKYKNYKKFLLYRNIEIFQKKKQLYTEPSMNKTKRYIKTIQIKNKILEKYKNSQSKLSQRPLSLDRISKQKN